ncbi:MAG: hypothetical protein HY254_07975 [Burkholderiales bacterium]|nr:hypothetical protein [Burkholderiales bacterium]
MSSHPILFAVLMFASLCATIKIWSMVLRRAGHPWGKCLLMFISVIPFFGPVFFVFIDAPPVLPLAEQEKPFPKGTEIYPDFYPLINSIRKIFGQSKVD